MGHYNHIREKFKKHLIEELDRKYHFYLLQSKSERKDAVDKHFRLLNGKIFNSFKDDRLLLCAYEKGKRGAIQLFEQIRGDFKVIPYKLGQDIYDAIRNRPEMFLEFRLRPSQATQFPMMRDKLEDIRDDQDVYNLVWRTMILQEMAFSPGEIITECHKNYEFEDRYPLMKTEDWEKVVRSFIKDIQTCYDLELHEIFKMTA